MTRPRALLVGVNRYPFLEDGDLRGCLNDVALFSALLLDRFGFAAEDVRVLRDEEATRAGILSAMDELVARAEAGGVAVFFFAGHGSRKRSGLPDGTYVESIVPHDSGRGAHPSRDVEDHEIDAFVQRLNAKTPHVTLIVDCCHSGSVTRDAFGEAVRGIAPPSEGRPVEGPGAPVRRPAWRLGEREAVVVAACEAHEQAGEHRVYRGGEVVRHGALTYFLAEALGRSAPDATWREVFSPLHRALSGEHPGQHPQVEGRIDDVVFGRREVRPRPHLEVTAADGDEVELAGGAAHAVAAGSLWAVQPPRAAGPAATLATVRIDDVKLTASRGTVVERRGARALRPGDWARPTEPPDAVTRYRRLLAIENADPGSRLRGRLSLTLLRHDAAAGFVEAERSADGSVAFAEGERAEIEIGNRSDGKLWVSLVQLGADGAVELLLPVSGHPTFRLGGFGLGAGETLRLAAGYYAMDPLYRQAVRGGLVLRLPQGLGGGGRLHLKLLATPRPVDFSFLEQGPRRLAAPAAGDIDWATETVTVRLAAQGPAGER